MLQEEFSAAKEECECGNIIAQTVFQHGAKHTFGSVWKCCIQQYTFSRPAANGWEYYDAALMVDLVYSAITWNANICSDFLQAWIKIPATFTDFDQPSSELLLAALQVKNAKLPPNESNWSVSKKPAIVCHDDPPAPSHLPRSDWPNFPRLNSSTHHMVYHHCISYSRSNVTLDVKHCCHVASHSWLDIIYGKQPAPLDFSYTVHTNTVHGSMQ